jgi:acyl-coenzyme A thioesterase PaaI-like protein
MLDLVTSMALAATLRLTTGFVTLELKTSFLSGAKPGVIYGEAVVKRLGSKIAFLEGQLSNEDGSLIALASATASINQKTSSAIGARS